VPDFDRKRRTLAALQFALHVQPGQRGGVSAAAHAAQAEDQELASNYLKNIDMPLAI
jgi:hypothetical protein